MKTKNKSMLAVAFLFGVVYILYTISPNHFIQHMEYLQPNSSTKCILLYDSQFSDTTWGTGKDTIGPEYFKSIQCPVTDCFVTNNRKLLTQITDCAVLFHIPNHDIQSEPDFRTPQQIYVAATMESPANWKIHFHTLMNWTMTCRLNSDIPWHYYVVIDSTSRTVVAPSEQPRWLSLDAWENYHNETLLKMVKKKNTMAAQFVSHCGAISKRDDLVRAMQNLTEVDVYGQCGTKRCPRGSPRCAQMLTDDYYFYLSFENSLCRDYVTEKLYNAMKSFVIPVVFGGASYSRFAPPHSYIDAQDFESVEELVSYLNYLKNNPREYVKYFWWKQHYQVIKSEPFCALCQKLHQVDGHTQPKFYEDLPVWWEENTCQLKPRIKF